MAKGYAIIGNDPFVPVEKDKRDKKDDSYYVPQDHQIAAYYLSHLDASLNFKFAIELKYEILSKNIKAFWKTYKGDKKSVKWLIKLEDASYDSLVIADQIRQDADLQLHISEKIPLLRKAEKMEENAEFQMEKILFTYQNFSTEPKHEWVTSADTLNPLVAQPLTKINSPKPISDSILNAFPIKDTSFYSLLHITEQQVDLFNDFLLEKFPNQVETYVMDFEKLKQSKIDSLQEEWNNFVLGQYVTSDTSFANAISKKNSPVQALAQLLKDAKTKRQLSKKPDVQPGSSSPKQTTTKKQVVQSVSSLPKDAITKKQNVQTVSNPPKDTITKKQVVQSVSSPPKDTITKKQNVRTITSAPKETTIKKEEVKTVPIPPKETAIKKQEVQTIASPPKDTAKNAPSVTQNSKSATVSVPDNLPDFLYHVQIAACREELSKRELKRKSNDSLTLVVTYEDNWYKYTSGIFTDYKTAAAFRDKIHLKGAFVVAYLNGKRIKITPYLICKKHH